MDFFCSGGQAERNLIVRGQSEKPDWPSNAHAISGWGPIYPCRVSHAILGHQTILSLTVHPTVKTGMADGRPAGWLVPRLLFGMGNNVPLTSAIHPIVLGDPERNS
jgi:hypothetical protein